MTGQRRRRCSRLPDSSAGLDSGRRSAVRKGCLVSLLERKESCWAMHVVRGGKRVECSVQGKQLSGLAGLAPVRNGLARNALRGVLGAQRRGVEQQGQHSRRLWVMWIVRC
jgi:hypothetical protein